MIGCEKWLKAGCAVMMQLRAASRPLLLTFESGWKHTGEAVLAQQAAEEAEVPELH